MKKDKLNLSLIGEYLYENSSILPFTQTTLGFYASPLFKNYHRFLSTVDGKPAETPLCVPFSFEQQISPLNIEDAIDVLKKNDNGLAICLKTEPAIRGIDDSLSNRIFLSYPVFNPDTKTLFQYSRLGEPVIIETKEEYYESLKYSISYLYESFFRSQRKENEETV